MWLQSVKSVCEHAYNPHADSSSSSLCFRLQVFLNTYGIQTQTPQQVEPIQIWPQKELVKVTMGNRHVSVVLSHVQMGFTSVSFCVCC